MMLPLIGLLAAAMTAVGGYTMYWYSSMTREDQEKADKLALQYAKHLYNKGLSELTSAQLSHVHDLVKKSFPN